MRGIETFKRIIIMAMSTICIAFQIGVYTFFWYSFFSMELYKKFWVKGHFLMIFVYAVLLILFSQMYGGMKIGYLKSGEVMFSQVFATICVNMITYFIICMLALKIVSVDKILFMTMVDIVIIILWTNLSSMIYKRIFLPRELLVIHGERSINDIVSKFETRKDKYRIKRCMNVEFGYETICREVVEGGYNAIVLWDIPAEIRNQLYKFCFEQSIRVYAMPKIPDILIKGADQLHLFDTPILLTREYVLSFEQRFAKRTIDFICALILLVITSPIMLIAAVVIKMYDKGPVLYKQTRCTRDLQEFSILKFRSMRVDAEKDGVARLAAKNDNRITPIGKFIRMVRIDELPQLINIIRGEMSFIGPRPERPQIIKQYLKDMPEFVYRTKVKAGLAGYAQVYGKYNTTPYDKLKLDLFYIENYTVWLDIKLMLLTLKILFKPESTEGIEQEQTTAIK